MASGSEMFDALRKAIKPMQSGESFDVNLSDALELGKLTEDDLLAKGFGPEEARRVEADLHRGNLSELGRALGIRLKVIKHKQNLIPGESLKRAAEILKNDPTTLEEDLEDLDRIRHPERCSG
jgi:hypothetical protein